MIKKSNKRKFFFRVLKRRRISKRKIKSKYTPQTNDFSFGGSQKRYHRYTHIYEFFFILNTNHIVSFMKKKMCASICQAIFFYYFPEKRRECIQRKLFYAVQPSVYTETNIYKSRKKKHRKKTTARSHSRTRFNLHNFDKSTFYLQSQNRLLGKHGEWYNDRQRLMTGRDVEGINIDRVSEV